MSDIAQTTEHKPCPNGRIASLFLFFHGNYGTAFTSKFATGNLDSNGKDRGTRSAMMVWQERLAEFPDDVLELAARRACKQNQAFPPNLPEFVRLCESCLPIRTYADINGLESLPAPTAPTFAGDFKHRHDGKDWARSILAGVEAGASRTQAVILFAKQALGVKNG